MRAQRGAVEYSLRAIPLGGYVAFPDDDPNSPFAKGARTHLARGTAGASGGGGAVHKG